MRHLDWMLAAAVIAAPASARADAMTDGVLAKSGGAPLKTVLATPAAYRFQVLVSIPKNGKLERHGYREDAEYYFPASSMKVPITLASYERLAAMRTQKPAMTRDAELDIFSQPGDPYVTTLARETLRALVVSDNDSANRILGFGGHQEINQTLWNFGLASSRVRTGFNTETPAEQSPRMTLAKEELPPRTSELKLPANDSKSLLIGKASIQNGQLVQGPMSFGDKNQIRIRDLQDALVRILQPELLGPNAKKDNLSQEDREYLTKTMGTLPSESGLAGYQRNIVSDYQLIPFLRGIERVRPRGKFTIHSKVGQAFGFLIGNARITDKETGKYFFLTAVIYANPNEVLNDDLYGYDTTSFPVLADVAEAFCRDVFDKPVDGVTFPRAEAHEVPGLK